MTGNTLDFLRIPLLWSLPFLRRSSRERLHRKILADVALQAHMIARRMRDDRSPDKPLSVAIQAGSFPPFHIVRDQRRGAFIGTRQFLDDLLGSNLLRKRATLQGGKQTKEKKTSKRIFLEWLHDHPLHFLDPHRALLEVWLLGNRIVGIKRHQID